MNDNERMVVGSDDTYFIDGLLEQFIRWKNSSQIKAMKLKFIEDSEKLSPVDLQALKYYIDEDPFWVALIISVIYQMAMVVQGVSKRTDHRLNKLGTDYDFRYRDGVLKLLIFVYSARLSLKQEPDPDLNKGMLFIARRHVNFMTIHDTLSPNDKWTAEQYVDFVTKRSNIVLFRHVLEIMVKNGFERRIMKMPKGTKIIHESKILEENKKTRPQNYSKEVEAFAQMFEDKPETDKPLDPLKYSPPIAKSLSLEKDHAPEANSDTDYVDMNNPESVKHALLLHKSEKEDSDSNKVYETVWSVNPNDPSTLKVPMFDIVQGVLRYLFQHKSPEKLFAAPEQFTMASEAIVCHCVEIATGNEIAVETMPDSSGEFVRYSFFAYSRLIKVPTTVRLSLFVRDIKI